MFQIWYIWFAIIRARVIISDYHKFNSLYSFASFVDYEGNYNDDPSAQRLTEEIYVRNAKIRKKANNVLANKINNKKLRTNFRITKNQTGFNSPYFFFNNLDCVY